MDRKPAWWLLYATIALLIVALVFVAHLQLSPSMQKLAEGGALVAGFGLLWHWCDGNQLSLEMTSGLDATSEKPHVVVITFATDADKLENEEHVLDKVS